MTPEQIITSRYPKTWSQLYALAYGEIKTLVESFFLGDIDKAELARLYRVQTEAQHLRVEKLVQELSEELRASMPPS